MTCSIFLAHASQDAEKVIEIYERLAARGYKPWLDKRDLKPGEDWDRAIRRQIQASNFFIACLSKVSVAKQGYVQKEFRFALDAVATRPPGNIYLIPLRLDDCEIPDHEISGIRLTQAHVHDLFGHESYGRLFEVFDSHVNPGHPPERVDDWDSEFHKCEFTIKANFETKPVYKDLCDIYVQVENPPMRSNIYLIPSGRIPEELRTRKLLDRPEFKEVKRQATEEFVQKFRKKSISGHWFFVRQKTAVKVYSSSYDSILMEWWSRQVP